MAGKKKDVSSEPLTVSPTGPKFCRFCRWRKRGQEMHRLKESGHTYREIALAYGLPEGSRSVVMRSINRYLADMKEAA